MNYEAQIKYAKQLKGQIRKQEESNALTYAYCEQNTGHVKSLTKVGHSKDISRPN